MKPVVLRDTVIEIDLNKIAWNMEQIKGMAGEHVKITAVVKADGYSHGAIDIAPTLMRHGASMLAVATLSEAVELKEAYAHYPVLIMGLTPEEYLPYVLEYNIIQTIDTLAQARALEQLAKARGDIASIHIKCDTGFHRLGFPYGDKGLEEIEEILNMEHIRTEGIYSHLALTDDASNEEQMKQFLHVIDALEKKGYDIPCKHMADSIAAVDYPEYRMDMIRVGAIIYGLKGFHKGTLDIRQALTFKTKISHITELKAGEGVSYDYLWRAPRDTKVATLPYGYADGYPRSLRDKGMVTLHGKQVPVIGVICMDQCVIDLTDVPEAIIGDEVIIYGDGTGNTWDIDAVSKLAGTNKNEILARLTRRSPRIYIPESEAFT